MYSTIVIPARLRGILPAPTSSYRSAALLCMGALGGAVWQRGELSARPAFCAALEQMGLKKKHREDAAAWLSPSRARLSPLRLDAAALPEEAPLLALCLSLAQGESEVCGLRELDAASLRRLRAALSALQTLGANVREQENAVRILGMPALPGGAAADASEPCLLPLLLAAASVCEKPLTLLRVNHADWPDWQSEYALLGGCLRPAGAQLAAANAAPPV